MKAGSRTSSLAMAQAEEFKAAFEKACAEVCQIVGITSHGDKDVTTHLANMGGIGVFVKELEEALAAGEIDCTVNSLKDIPAKIDPRFTVAAVLPRADVRDATIPLPLDKMVCGTILGTSSVRRERMIRAFNPTIRIKTLRGNMNTRISKLEAGEYNAIVMAKAGLDRLGISYQVNPVDKRILVPAAGQGAIGIECRADDAATIEKLRKLDDARPAPRSASRGASSARWVPDAPRPWASTPS
ncbi:hydroxymethylbilane synthase [Candidatus Methanomethylophilus sp. 1R26]|uniref:hydroxymethylbilane synthase n=1 Tax=Candidatus Methanomethylophilus sp. 1R26 TaxID=1769296 RepID=UPI000B2E9EDD|nr:hydroxymethylbilane synthase [Candidatus Methanomethylophilus sp. 1R26]